MIKLFFLKEKFGYALRCLALTPVLQLEPASVQLDLLARHGGEIAIGDALQTEATIADQFFVKVQTGEQLRQFFLSSKEEVNKMSDEERIFIEVPQISLEDQQKYRGKDVAIVDGKVVAAGYSSVEVFRKARELFPNKPAHEIIIADIPMEDMLIL